MKKQPEEKVKVNLKSLGEGWPSTFVARGEINKFTGGLLTSKYIANLDCLGRGIPKRIRIGRKIIYRVADCIHWLESRAEIVDGG